MNAPVIECPCCHGSGKTPLPPALSETLECLSKKPISTAEVYAQVKGAEYVCINAISNRLAKLFAMGFAGRERRGKEYFWTRVK